MHTGPIIVASAIAAGAAGYVIKDNSTNDLKKAFEKVRAGHRI